MESLWCLIFLLSIFNFREIISTSTVSGHHGIVATDNFVCSTIGRKVLQKGGHAVDAAVAAALCLGVVSPASSGIGGGDFMVVRTADGIAEAYDMRETTPKLANVTLYAQNSTLKQTGALSVAVPGELLGLEAAWKKYGRLPWSKLVAPSVHLANRGFKISAYLHMQMVSSESAIMVDEGLRTIFTSNGTLLKTGDICKNMKLAKTLRLIARYGAKAFYNGSIGVDLVNDLKRAGGILTLDDLRNYEIRVRKPVVVDTMGVKIYTMPPPSSGGVAMALILNILEQYHDLSNISKSLMTHRTVEALKHAFAVRMNLGDPDFVDIRSVVKDMLSKEFAAQLKKTIFDNMTFNSTYYGGRWNQINDHGTSHVSIVDSERNAVSMTCTINGYFGAKILSPSTGIVLNNEMDDFSIPGNNSGKVTPPNLIYPKKRPLSSMSPTIVLKDGKLKAVVGASGGGYIIAGTTEVLLNHLVRGMDPLSAVKTPRAYHQLVPNVLLYENWTVPTGERFEVPAEIRVALAKKGHVLQGLAGGTICQFIVQELNGPNNGKLIGVSDPRKGGFPSGF